MAERKVMNCRSCGKLMGQAETCPYCGRARNSPLGFVTSLLGAAAGPAGVSMTKLIIGFCLFVFAVGLILSYLALGPESLGRALFNPSGLVLQYMGANSPAVFHGMWWTTVTSVFLHIGLIHLGFNLYALSIVGPIMENSIGRAAFWVLFIVSGVAGAFLSAFHGNNAAGASGAIMGLVGGGIAISLMAGRRMDDPLLRTFVTWAGFTFAFGWLSGLNIDNWGHFGGFAAGALFGALWYVFQRSSGFRRTLVPLAVTAFAGVVYAYASHVLFVLGLS